MGTMTFLYCMKNIGDVFSYSDSNGNGVCCMAKKRIALIVAVMVVAVFAVILGLRYKTMTDTLSDIDYIVVYKYSEDEAALVGRRLDIDFDEWELHLFKISPHHSLNLMVGSTVVMNDGTEYEAYYYPNDYAFSIFGGNGFYAAKNIATLKGFY